LEFQVEGKDGGIELFGVVESSSGRSL